MAQLSEYEQNLIFEHYEYGDFDWLSKTLDKEKNTITEWARKRGLKRKISVRRNGNLTPLISGSLESFYYLGLIAADGYISKNGHFMLSQVEKDKEIIDNLAKFLGSSIYQFIPSSGYSARKPTFRVNIYDSNIGKQIREMFGIQDSKNKTESGIKLDFIKSFNNAIAFLLGFIDGDGCIYKNLIRIQCHHSWLTVFSKLEQMLPAQYSGNRVFLEYKKKQQKHYATWSIKANQSRLLKQFAIQNSIPISTRKWSVVDETKCPRLITPLYHK